jgi:hypothetical protein
MSNAEKKPQIDDVLSSIKRLVSDEVSSSKPEKPVVSSAFSDFDAPDETALHSEKVPFVETPIEDKPSALILTPALRVVADLVPDSIEEHGFSEINAALVEESDQLSLDESDIPDTDVDRILDAISRDVFPERHEEEAEETHQENDPFLEDGSQSFDDTVSDLELETEQNIGEQEHSDDDAFVEIFTDVETNAESHFEVGDSADMDPENFADGEVSETAEQNVDVEGELDLELNDGEDQVESHFEEPETENSEHDETTADDVSAEVEAEHNEQEEVVADDISEDHEAQKINANSSEFYENEHVQEEHESGSENSDGLNINLDAILGRKAAMTPTTEEADVDIQAMAEEAIEAVVVDAVESAFEEADLDNTAGVDEDLVEPVSQEEVHEWQDEAGQNAEAAQPLGDDDDDDANSIEEMMTAEINDIDDDYQGGDEDLIDESMLRDLVAQYVRAELQGSLGERITRNVRKLVRREIHRVLESKEFE